MKVTHCEEWCFNAICYLPTKSPYTCMALCQCVYALFCSCNQLLAAQITSLLASNFVPQIVSCRPQIDRNLSVPYHSSLRGLCSIVQPNSVVASRFFKLVCSDYIIKVGSSSISYWSNQWSTVWNDTNVCVYVRSKDIKLWRK